MVPFGRCLICEVSLHNASGNCYLRFTLKLHHRHVVQKRLPVNIAVFCDFIDYLCSSFVLYNRYQYASILHDVTLPRSWLLMLAKIEERGVKAAGLFRMLIDPMSELLEQMYSGINAGP